VHAGTARTETGTAAWGWQAISELAALFGAQHLGGVADRLRNPLGEGVG
jgi:hypothetical protein